MKIFLKKAAAVLMAAALVLAGVSFGGTDANAEETGTLNIKYHTKGEIKAFVDAHPVNFLKAEYKTQPGGTNPGELTDAVKQDALNAINTVRYIAGLPYNITIDADQDKMAQSAAYVNNTNSKMSHTPTRPSGWGSEYDTVYDLGYKGASSSNIAAGYYSLASAVINGWMYDGDSSNIDRVGHRRWVINPYMETTGFGQVGSHMAMYAFGYGEEYWDAYYDAYSSREELESKGKSLGSVSVWPAPNMPISYFNTREPWSYSTGMNEEGDVKVVLKKNSTGQTWSFSNSSADGYFNVNNVNYGIMGCVIFRPDNITFSAGDVFTVNITGLAGGDVSYTVEFFDLASTVATTPDSDFDPTARNYMGWYVKDGKSFWYEGGVRQGDSADGKNFAYDGSVRGREIYDPASNAWYWLDVIYGGAKASNKEVFMPYIYSNEKEILGDNAKIEEYASCSNRTSPEVVDMSAQVAQAIRNNGKDGGGKWVRYDGSGKMIKGWYTVQGTDAALYPDQVGNTYYYDQQTGLMAKGHLTIDGVNHYFDEITGAMQY